MGALRGGDDDARGTVPRSVSVPGAGATAEPLSGRADRGGREPPDRPLDLRASGEVLHGGRWTRPRGGRGGGSGRGGEPIAEDRIHGREVADHAPAGALSRPGG